MLEWTNETAIAFLKAALDPTLWEVIRDRTKLTTALDALLARTFPAKNRIHYDKQLSLLYQNHFNTIAEYDKAVKKCLYRWQTAAAIPKVEASRRYHDTFMRGLSQQTLLKMRDQGIEDPSEIIKKIQGVEELLDQLSYNPISSVQPANSTSKRETKDSTSSKTSLKWCPYHRSPHHDKSECKARPETEKRSSALLIQEPRQEIPQISLDGKINQTQIQAIVDTGARKNYMSSETAKSFGLTMENQGGSKPVELGDGSQTSILGTTATTLTLNQFPKYTFEEHFEIIPGSLKEILLGSPFLNSNNVAIDYRSKTLRIKEHTLFLGNPEAHNVLLENPDKLLAEKLNFIGGENPRRACLRRIADQERQSGKLETIIGASADIPVLNPSPVIQKPIPVPITIRKDVQKEIARLLEEKIIRKARNSSYASPAFPILKKNKSIRLVIDYRKINSFTIKEAFPFPNVQDHLNSIPKSNVFSSIDLKSGYHQIELAETSRKYSGFVILGEHYEFLRLPFGLTNAPRIFQSVMQQILGHLPFVRVFLDDILIFSENEEEHIDHLDTVLEHLKTRRATISFEKSKFFQTEIPFLGHIISSEGIKPGPSRIPDLEPLYVPKTKKKLLNSWAYSTGTDPSSKASVGKYCH